MELIGAIKVKFPVSAEGPVDGIAYTPDQNGRWPVHDAEGDELCTTSSFEYATALESMLNLAYEGEESVVVEIGS